MTTAPALRRWIDAVSTLVETLDPTHPDAPHALAEAGIALCYHATSVDGAVEIITSGFIKADTGARINNRYQYGVSLSRSRWYANRFNTITFGFDLAKLRQGFGRRLVPTADPMITLFGTHVSGPEGAGKNRIEAEEFLLAPLPLHRYLVGIWSSPAVRELPTTITGHPRYHGAAATPHAAG